MAFTQAQLDALDDAYASGLQRATVNGQLMEWRSIAEFKAIRAEIAQALASQADPTQIRVRQVRMYSDKGF